ncbi:hypothetical protein C2G38_2043585 [Gigaspora rosea]|uniref:Uncharacterized protein n=1 Tax=Gigaspora rosea TaxID=44941 RepID=A0A397UT10_9GLOM|nr:hypothetical protein C2G38_2043585 [Gigaspora rosea]
MAQSFLSMPTFSKTYLYTNSTILYYEFCNAFAFFTMVKSCNSSMNRQDLMNTANKEWRKYWKESETTIKNQINQYLIASPSIVRTTTFFLPPNSPNIPNIPSSESSTSDSASSNLLVSNSSSLLSVEIPTIAPNAPA